MPGHRFAVQLQHYGPQASPVPPRPSLDQARTYCRRLAGGHYENFIVASLLLPKSLRQHFCNLYAYCRWADDLADETGDTGHSLELLDWWQQQLLDCYQGRVRHPVFVALEDTVHQFAIPPGPFLDLLVAFRQDQRQTRYETFEQLSDYCRYSANPVGRLVLYLSGCHDPSRGRLADSICTGLQLANFWQDVARDYDRGRIYLPLDDCRRFGYDEARLARRTADEPFRRLLAWQVERAGSYLAAGRPLVAQMPSAVRGDVELFVRGGLAVLQAIRRADYDVWSRRPVVSKWTQLRLLAATWWQAKQAAWRPRKDKDER